MNLKRFTIVAIITWCVCLIAAIGTTETVAPVTTVRVPQTVQITQLSPQQQAERIEAINAETSTTTSTTTTTVVPATFTTVVAVDPETKCQEWLPIAVSVGWPNDQKMLEKLARLMWKESRCLPNVISDSNDHGLTQINARTHRAWVEELFAMPLEQSMADPTLNLRFAYLLWESVTETGRCGFDPWSMNCD